MLLRDEHRREPATFDIDLGSAAADVVADRRIRQLGRSVLVCKPRENPARGMTLLSGSVKIGAQHLVDGALERIQPRRRANPHLPLRRLSLLQRQTDCQPANTMTAGELPIRETLHPRITPNPRE